MVKVFFVFSIAIFITSSVFPGIYNLDYTTKEKEAEVTSKEENFVKLRLKESPQQPIPLFIYNIEKIKDPYKIPEKVFQDSIYLIDKGNACFSKSQYQEAAQFYTEAIKVNPSFVSSYHNLGLAYFMLGRYSESADNFKSILSIQPLNGYPYLYLGWIYKRLENPRMSEYYLNVARKIFTSENNMILVRQVDDILDSLKFFSEE